MAKIFLAVIISLSMILWGAEDVGAQYPRISVSPVRGRIGETFSVTGRGFQSFESVTVRFSGKGRSLTADYSGNIKTSFVIPPIDPGIYSVDAYFATVVISSIFEIIPPAIFAPTLFMAGDRITIQVWGAVPFSEARVYLNENEITPSPRPTVGPNGTATVETLVPSLAPGYYILSLFRGTKFETGQVINLIPDPPGRVEKVLAPISQQVERVWGYDNYYGWQFYDPAIPPELNTLKEFVEGRGYFIKVKQDCELAAVGGRVYKLYAGWNLIGW